MANWLEAMAQLSSKEAKDKQAYEDRLHEQFQEANRRIGRVSVFKGSDHKALGEFTKNRNGPRELDSAVSEIFLGFQAAKSR